MSFIIICKHVNFLENLTNKWKIYKSFIVKIMLPIPRNQC